MDGKRCITCLPSFTSAVRLKRQSLPAFRLGIDPENFDIAATILANDGDTSPLCLSIDDTALVPKLRSLYDTQRKTWHLLGHVSDDGNTAFGADLIFDREEDVRAAIEENVLKKGTKVRSDLESAKIDYADKQSTNSVAWIPIDQQHTWNTVNLGRSVCYRSRNHLRPIIPLDERGDKAT
jgi:hypothetical protein